MKVLVTGGAGYIGSHVSHALIDKGHNVTIIDNLITGFKELIPKKAKLVTCDISDEKKVTEVLVNEKFDLVMHFAGLIRVDESVREPKKYNEYNFNKAKIFLETCFKNDLNNIIFSSTASVYGNPKNGKVCEDDLLQPLNPYATSKLNLEKFIVEKSKNKEISYIILRYFNVAGADEKMRTGLKSKKSTHLIKIACEVAVGKKDEIIINGEDYETLDGTPVRDYIHVSDLADIHLLTGEYLVKNRKSNLFNCGYGKGYSVKQVIDSFNEILDQKINYKFGPRRPGDSMIIVADTNKFNKFFSWKPKFDNLKYILKSAFEWEKKIK